MNTIPAELEQISFSISKDTCLYYIKDFGFFHSKTKFAKIFSCITSIETLILKNHKQGAMMTGSSDTFKYDQLSIFRKVLLDNDFIFSDHLLQLLSTQFFK